MTEPITPDPDPTELPVGDVDEPGANPQSSELAPEVPSEEVEAFFTDEDFESEPEVVNPHLDQSVAAVVVVHDALGVHVDATHLGDGLAVIASSGSVGSWVL